MTCTCQIDYDEPCPMHGMNRPGYSDSHLYANEGKQMDYYDRAVAHFSANPHFLNPAWHAPALYEFGHLFAFCTRSRDVCFIRPQLAYLLPKPGPIITSGNPVQVSRGEAKAETRELTRSLREDDRLKILDDPADYAKLPGLLVVLAEWQRRIDSELGRCVPQISQYTFLHR